MDGAPGKTTTRQAADEPTTADQAIYADTDIRQGRTLNRVGARAALALLLAAAPLAAADAQTRPDPTQRPEPAPQSAPSNPAAAPPEKIAPAPNPREDSGSSGESLGDHLSRSNGTITPPRNVDPGMATQPPDPGPHSMPVLPPPGTDGNSTITPK